MICFHQNSETSEYHGSYYLQNGLKLFLKRHILSNFLLYCHIDFSKNISYKLFFCFVFLCVGGWGVRGYKTLFTVKLRAVDCLGQQHILGFSDCLSRGNLMLMYCDLWPKEFKIVDLPTASNFMVLYSHVHISSFSSSANSQYFFMCLNLYGREAVRHKLKNRQ